MKLKSNCFYDVNTLKKKKKELYDVNTVSLIWWNSEAYFKR